MTRRRWLIVLARMLTAWTLLTVQGVCDTAHLAALGLVPAQAPLACSLTAPTPVSADSQHAMLCKCRACRGPKHCCCVSAQTPVDAARMRAVCDTPEEPTVPGMIGPLRGLPPVLLAVRLPLDVPIADFTAPPLARWQSRTLHPSTPPPCV